MRKKWIYNTLIVIFAVVFLVSAGMLVAYYIDASRQAQRYDVLSDLHGNVPRPTIPQESDTETEIIPDVPALTAVTDPETGKTVYVLPEFAELYTLNNDIVGWMTIPGTNIDYPVMQTPDNPDYYLKRNFDREQNSHGCLYARESCDIDQGDNVTVYGHRMKDGSMFAGLDSYKNKAFFETNPLIYFDSLQQRRTYQIMAVFRTTATVGEGFTYHTFEQTENAAEFDAFVAECKALSLYDTGVTASYGDQLVTLSTCEYSQTNGRLVVVAKRIA